MIKFLKDQPFLPILFGMVTAFVSILFLVMVFTQDIKVKEAPVISQWKPLSNETIIRMTKECTDAGLSAESLIVPEHGALIIHIQCNPRPMGVYK